ncbi:hypothetical protein H0X06_06645 [Candidatus Dependentiae bacterium]|nr:hypothetical protein [Candidatus Dependentiae bacterium]
MSHEDKLFKKKINKPLLKWFCYIFKKQDFYCNFFVTGLTHGKTRYYEKFDYHAVNE